ncbi:MAG: isopeptide-forming domain-containing fimbrial protein [Oscillospiraceae bacterium]|nr:isopeptide-forming domain-containing fimbrial protein [Oscillospiraceae bacterium]
MKMTKRIFSLALALVMLVCMATSVSALNLTITGEKDGHLYDAYQIFSGELDGTSTILTDVHWGIGIDQTQLAALLAALQANAEIGPDFAGLVYDLVDPAANTFTAEAVADKIKEYENDGAKAQAFAAVLGAINPDPAAKATNPFLFLDETKVSDTAEKNPSSLEYTFELPAGYYLITDRPDSVDLEHDFYTRYLLALTTSTGIAVKGDYPDVKKEVSNTLESGYSEQTSNQLNKVHYYEWTGTIPADIEDYDWYYYEFKDTLSAGLSFLNWEQVWIQKSNGEYIWLLDTTGKQTKFAEAAKLAPNNYYPKEADLPTDGSGLAGVTISMSWDDLMKAMKDAGRTLQGGDTVHVRYSAKLNKEAIIGNAGNENLVELIYSNNPDDKDDKGKTPPTDPRVYTFQLEVTKFYKVGGVEHKLPGAEFVLYHEHGTTPYYAVVEKVGGYNKIVNWVTDINLASKITSDANGKMYFAGLQKSVGYFLQETKAPTDFNLLKNNVKIQITDYTVDSTTHEVTSITYQVNAQSNTSTGETAKAGLITAKVENKTGTELPTTGGMGTTMFYIAGGIMVAAAVILLISKKRKVEE